MKFYVVGSGYLKTGGAGEGTAYRSFVVQAETAKQEPQRKREET